MRFKTGDGWSDNLVLSIDGKFVKVADIKLGTFASLIMSEDGAELFTYKYDDLPVYARTTIGVKYELGYDDSLSIDLAGEAMNVEIVTGSGDDVVRLPNRGGVIYSRDGNDKIFGGRDLDYIQSGDGNDKISAGAGGDYIFGGAGKNKIWGGSGEDYYFFEGDETHTIIKDYEKHDTVVVQGISLDHNDVQVKSTKKGAVMTYEYHGNEIEVLFEGASAKSLTLDFRPD